MVTAGPAEYGIADGHALDPDRIADTVWAMYQTRDRAEEVFDRPQRVMSTRSVAARGR